jgi:hypothetical protein
MRSLRVKVTPVSAPVAPDNPSLDCYFLTTYADACLRLNNSKRKQPLLQRQLLQKAPSNRYPPNTLFTLLQASASLLK